MLRSTERKGLEMSVWTTLLIAATLGGDASCAAPAPGCTAKSAPACQPCAPRVPCKTACDSKPCAVVNCHPCPQPVNPCSPCPTTCDPCSSCDPCNVCCDPCSPCCIPGSKCWSKACKHSTCNLYPHYPYIPQCHGYYNFRPYNWVHIDQHRLTIPGENFKNPYSNDVFDRLYAGKDNLGEINSDQPRPFNNQLPKLEALLK